MQAPKVPTLRCVLHLIAPLMSPRGAATLGQRGILVQKSRQLAQLVKRHLGKSFILALSGPIPSLIFLSLLPVPSSEKVSF